MDCMLCWLEQHKVQDSGEICYYVICTASKYIYNIYVAVHLSAIIC